MERKKLFGQPNTKMNDTSFQFYIPANTKLKNSLKN